jgi:hypothetical protein
MRFPAIQENLIGTASNLNRVYCLHKYILKIYKLIIFSLNQTNNIIK